MGCMRAAVSPDSGSAVPLADTMDNGLGFPIRLSLTIASSDHVDPQRAYPDTA